MINIINRIGFLSSALKELSPISTEFQSTLDYKFRLEFNYNSNHMEGNTLTYGETELLLKFDKTEGNHTLREYEEMKAHDVAYRLIKEWAADSNRPLTEMDIRNLNEVILVEPFWKEALTPDGQNTRRRIEIGTYKKFPNSVRQSNGEMFEYASVTDTPMLMEKMMQWYREEEQKNELHPVALAAILHHKFVSIHPFDDGNGRTSRLLMNYVLLKNNLPPIVIKSSDKRKYLAALNAADVGDINSFIKYIAEQLVWSLELSIKAAKGESIEEPDDLEKEISIWKKNHISSIPTPIHRNDREVYEIYTHGIKELFEEFENKCKKNFYELFEKAICYTYINNSGQEGIHRLTHEIEKIKVVSADINEIYSSVNTNDTFKMILLDIKLDECKYNPNNTFSILARLRIDLNLYNYEVGDENKSIRKMYGEFLNADERRQIIDDRIKDIFTQIKEKSKEGKAE